MKLQPYSDYSDYEERLLDCSNYPDVWAYLGIRRIEL